METMTKKAYRQLYHAAIRAELETLLAEGDDEETAIERAQYTADEWMAEVYPEEYTLHAGDMIWYGGIR